MCIRDSLIAVEITYESFGRLELRRIPVVKDLETGDERGIISGPILAGEVDKTRRVRIHIDCRGAVCHINGQLVVYKKVVAVNDFHILTTGREVSFLIRVHNPLKRGDPLRRIDMEPEGIAALQWRCV